MALQDDGETKRLMASIRRLRAALAPGIPRDAVVAELRKILESEGMENLLADSADGYFAGILSKARVCVESTKDERDLFHQLGAILNSEELNAALLTDDPDEQPLRLRKLMLEGPYRDLQSS